MGSPRPQRLGTFLAIFHRRFSRVDLQEHEDKILLFLALVISAVVGLVVVAFVAITERMGRVLLTAGPNHRFLSPLIGALVSGWLLYRFFPDARGSGIPQTRVALILRKGVISLRTVIGKFVCSAISLGSGVALGREGPSVQIGAGIASVAGRRLGLSEEHVRSLIPVGTAAAVAAAFNTPLAAVLFTLEEILADLHARLVGSVVIGAATSWIILRLILGDEPLFHVPAYQLVHPIEFLLYAVLGILGGLTSTVFVKMTLAQRARFLMAPPKWRAFTPAVGGFAVGLLALAHPGVLGVGYNLVSDALNGRMELQIMLLLLALKVVATSTSYGSGNAGGVFGPSLFIGAMLGGTVGQAAHILFPARTGDAGAYALVGMGVVFAGIVRTPMTSVIMIFEVTRDYTIIVPLMIANLCSYLLAKRLHKMPLYEALSHQDGILMPSPDHLPEPLTVEQAMRGQTVSIEETAPGVSVHPDDTLDTALQRMGAAGCNAILVVSRSGTQSLGVLGLADIVDAYQKSSLGAPPAQARNWLPVVGVVTVAAVFVISGLVVWQRSHRSDVAGESYRHGQELLAQGKVDDAVTEFRNALARAPEDVNLRTALGLALIESERWGEATAYLSEVVKVQPESGPVWAGLAKIASVKGDTTESLRLYQRALGQDWTDEGRRRSTQMDYSALLAQAGRKSDAALLLLDLIGRSGDDPSVGKRAAEMLESTGSAEQIEAALATLAQHFPADSEVWMGLGESRERLEKDALALEAYRNSVNADSGNAKAVASVKRLEDIIRLDPNRAGLPVRERARRWNMILERILVVDAECASKQEVERAKALLEQRTATLETLDKKVEATKEVWKSRPASCGSDDVLARIFSRTGQLR